MKNTYIRQFTHGFSQTNSIGMKTYKLLSTMLKTYTHENDFNQENIDIKNGKGFLRFIKNRKALIIFHKYEDQMNRNKSRDTINHFHIMWRCSSQRCPSNDSTWQKVIQEYWKETDYKHKISNTQSVKFPSALANYFCKPARQFLLATTDETLQQLNE